MVLIVLVGGLFFFYAGLIFFYNNWWSQLPEFLVGQTRQSTRFSVIIPARNEADNIGILLASLQQQSYPKDLWEVLVVDDHSTDNTSEIAAGFAGVRVISLQTERINSYKKEAITTGLAYAKNEWIVSTDADCTVPTNWLKSLAAIITEKDSVFVAAPVCLVPNPFSKKTFRQQLLYIFQTLDFLTLQGITAASVSKNVHSMCNGANLAYKKEVFYEVNGFKGIDDIASGDDMLLMHKIWKRYPERVHYLKSKDAIVQTLSAIDLPHFVNQRIRWASKATHYEDKRISTVLLAVYLFNISFIVLLVASFFHYKFILLFLFFWIAKTLVEYPFVSKVSLFFEKTSLLKYFFLMQPLHIAYTIIAGFLGSVGHYEWKGRWVK